MDDHCVVDHEVGSGGTAGLVVRRGRNPSLPVAMALIDPDVVPVLGDHRWRLHSSGRAYRRDHGRVVLLERQIMGVADLEGDAPVSHVDGDYLNCRRANLRVSRRWLLDQLDRWPEIERTAVDLAVAAANRTHPSR